jgi:hypothetical protein
MAVLVVRDVVSFNSFHSMFKFSKVPWQNLDYSHQGGDIAYRQAGATAALTPRSVAFLWEFNEKPRQIER